MEIKLINSSLSYLRLFTKPIHTTEYNEPVKYDLLRHLHQLTFRGESESVIIEFTAKSADLLPLWMQYHFSEEKRKFLRQSLLSEMESLIYKSETHLRFNIDRLRDSFLKDNCFGDCYFRLDMDDTIHPNLAYDIEIQDLMIFNSNNKLIYRKSGVYLDSEKPMIISDYRHLLEWIPNESKLKIINLDISRGQKYPSQSRPYIVFELNYSEERPFVKWGNNVGKRTGSEIDKWYTYVNQVIQDMNINNKVYKLLKKEKNMVSK